MEQVAALFNTQAPPISEDAWVSFRVVIVLDPISHQTPPISGIPNIKSFSCFRPYNYNRVAMKRLPCHCAKCLTMVGVCENQEMAGWFDTRGTTGKYVVQYIEPSKNVRPQIRLPLPARSQHSLEATLSLKDVQSALKKATRSKKRRAALKSPRAKTRKPADYANPVISAQTRKNLPAHKKDRSRYTIEEKEQVWTEEALASQKSFLVPSVQSSPLRPNTAAKTPVQAAPEALQEAPPPPATPAQPVAQRNASSVPTNIAVPKKRGPKAGKKRGPKAGKKRSGGPGRKRKMKTRLQEKKRKAKKHQKD